MRAGVLWRMDMGSRGVAVLVSMLMLQWALLRLDVWLPKVGKVARVAS